MKSFKSLYILLALVFISVAFMSFIPSANSIDNKNNTQLVTPDPGETNDLSVGWKTVDVYQNTSNEYIVLYSDLVSGLAENHTITWGCGYIDIDPNTYGWDCNVTTQWFNAGGAEGCEYIGVHSNSVLDPAHPTAWHTIRVKVKDDQNIESNWGGITLQIHYTPNPDNSAPANPCISY